MNKTIRIAPFALTLFISVFLSCKSETTTEILWDNYGVPHIYGRNAEEMYYAFGWAQMSSHANLILRLYSQSRGTASEYFGRSFIESDKKVLSFDLPRLASDGYRKQNGETRLCIDAFVKGMNDFAEKHPDQIDEKSHKILPVTVNDILAHSTRITCLEFLAGDDLETVKQLTVPGSNAIAIAPSKSASGNAMLLTNPHLPWNDFFIWFEAHLNTGGFNAYGVALVGMPSLSMAFNDNLGWAHTVNPIDASDRYELTLKDDGYLLDGKVKAFEKRLIVIKVKNDDGSVEDVTFGLKISDHGPVVAEKGDKAYAVRIAGLENSRIFEQYYKMAGAKNLHQFESALGLMQNPMFNVIYADNQGNIMYLFNGNIPVRTKGDFYFWRGTVSGTESEYIWNKFHPYEDLPRVLNPETGFVQNCNDPPWTCTYPCVLNPDDFPAYFAPKYITYRSQRAVNMVKDNKAISFNQLIDYKLNTGMEVADRFLDELIRATEEFPDTMANKAAEVLKKWDKKTDSESRGAVLFAAWWDQVKGNLFEKKWDSLYPFTTPSGIKDKEAAVKLLSKVSAEITAKYGSLDVAWGDVNRFRINGLDFPANGGPESYGIFRTVYFVDGENNTKSSIAGDTYIAVTEFGKEVKAEVLLSYGNSTQPGNKHSGDQLKMMSEKKLRPALFKRSDVLKNLEKTETFDK
jgi:acyl-homoserine-lactone acylase